jgi:hypothetical protein
MEFVMEKKIILLLVLLGVTRLAFIGCSSNSGKEQAQQAKSELSYQCPMDCEMGKFYANKGACPVCEMDMTQVDR